MLFFFSNILGLKGLVAEFKQLAVPLAILPLSYFVLGS
jgi:hypothetical protein